MRQKRGSSESYELSCFFALHIRKAPVACRLWYTGAGTDFYTVFYIYRFESSVYDRKSVKSYEWIFIMNEKINGGIMDNRNYTELYAALQKETTILTAQIRALYRELDRKFHLRGAQIPITFGFETDTLGSYTRDGHHEKEHFHFSLLFVGYGVKNPLKKEDRMDLYRHEYAHYMEHHIPIPKEYQWQPGLHGSAWKYCCSLIGAAPTPYYKAGEALMNHDYDKVLKNRIHDKSVPVRDTYQQLKTAQKKKDEVVQYKLGDAVTHPKFGHGIVEKINQRSGGVHLHIRFDGEVKCIDQKWLSRKKYT